MFDSTRFDNTASGSKVRKAVATEKRSTRRAADNWYLSCRRLKRLNMQTVYGYLFISVYTSREKNNFVFALFFEFSQNLVQKSFFLLIFNRHYMQS